MDRKAITKAKIEQALADLLVDNCFERITTQEIAAKAGISRGGFYTHFKDKYDLAERYEAKVFDKIHRLLQREHLSLAEILELSFNFVKNEPLATGLLGPNGSSEMQSYFIVKFKNFLMKDEAYIPALNAFSGADKEHAASYFASGLFGIFRSWMAMGMEETPRDMSLLLDCIWPKEFDFKNKR